MAAAAAAAEASNKLLINRNSVATTRISSKLYIFYFIIEGEKAIS